MKKTQFIKNRLNNHRKMLEKLEALKEELLSLWRDTVVREARIFPIFLVAAVEN